MDAKALTLMLYSLAHFVLAVVILAVIGAYFHFRQVKKVEVENILQGLNDDLNRLEFTLSQYDLTSPCNVKNGFALMSSKRTWAKFLKASRADFH